MVAIQRMSKLCGQGYINTLWHKMYVADIYEQEPTSGELATQYTFEEYHTLV